MKTAKLFLGAALAAALALGGDPARADHAFLDVREFVKGITNPCFDVGPFPYDALEDTVRFALWFPKAKAAAGLPAGCVLAGTLITGDIIFNWPLTGPPVQYHWLV